MVKPLDTLTPRELDVFNAVVENYMQTGKPIGSRDLSQKLGKGSPATMRNMMADLEDWELFEAPHTSGGRMPTREGLRLFLDQAITGFQLPEADICTRIEKGIVPEGGIDSIFAEASRMVSELSKHAAIVATPKIDRIVDHIEFRQLGSGNNQFMALMAFTDRTYDNRVFTMPGIVTASALQKASDYMNRLSGKTIAEMRQAVQAEIVQNKNALDTVTASLAEAGLVIRDTEKFFVQGRGNLLLEDVKDKEFKEMQNLIDILDEQERIAELLQATDDGQGVRIFLGHENKLMPSPNLGLVAAKALDGNGRMIGSINVIGPIGMNYRQIVPIVDYTAQIVARAVANLKA